MHALAFVHMCMAVHTKTTNVEITNAVTDIRNHNGDNENLYVMPKLGKQ